MVKFKRIFWKNFLSTGNAGNEIQLDKVPNTIITGKNGFGKSTLLDSISFALFGKPFRSINKPLLVNSINGKQCLVEVEFDVDTKQYKVIRGMKPNVFEIWCDGKLVNQESATKDYQKILEQQILKFNYKAFTQVVVLGSAIYTPFMKLPAAQRREVIEDILDIRIFSVMNTLLKDKTTETKQSLDNLETAIRNTKTQIEAQKKLVQTISDARSANMAIIQEKINENLQQIELTNAQIEESKKKLEDIKSKMPNKTELDSRMREFTKLSSKYRNNLEQCNTHKEFFDSNHVCPSCEQEITDSHKEKIISELDSKALEYEETLSKLESCHEKLASKIKLHDDLIVEYNTESVNLSTLQNTISFINEQVTKLNKELTNLNSNNTDLKEEKSKLREMAKTALEAVEEKTKLLEERNLQEIGSVLLKDNGIKTKIIREYLPLMNVVINKYLNAMDLFIKFELDENFNEVIKSRHRDTFSYDSFSEGEKNKINTSIMLAWRQIAKMKNSINTNLLIMDEIMDSSLDNSSVDMLMDVLSQLGENTNIFIISHRSENINDMFDRTIEVTKINDFSVLKEIEV